jgi:PAT family beta-lactamase induction signal transducer AmpG
MQNSTAPSFAKRSPWFYVPSLYFQQGLPVIIVQQASVVFYKNMGVSNDRIGLLTSLIAWPWILKMLWAPAIEFYRSRRFWILFTQAIVTVSLAAAAFMTESPHFLIATLAVFAVTAFASATHDTALDGYYMLALRPDRQAFFVGIRSSAFRLAMLFANGVLVMLAGYWAETSGSITGGWRTSLLVGAGLYGVLFLYAFIAMPAVATDRPVATAAAVVARATSRRSQEFVEALASFFRQKHAWIIVVFILFYRFSESMVSKMMGPFFLDPIEKGGLGLSTLQVGMIMGQVGMFSLTLGGLIGGIIISRTGLKKLIWPMVFGMHVPILAYIWAAYTQPHLQWVYLITAIDQFGYGFGMAAYTIFVMEIASASKYATSHFAIGTALMSLGAMGAGILSGYLQVAVGYPHFFVGVCICAIPGIAIIPFLPYREDSEGAPPSSSVSEVEALGGVEVSPA